MRDYYYLLTDRYLRGFGSRLPRVCRRLDGDDNTTLIRQEGKGKAGWLAGCQLQMMDSKRDRHIMHTSKVGDDSRKRKERKERRKEFATFGGHQNWPHALKIASFRGWLDVVGTECRVAREPKSAVVS